VAYVISLLSSLLVALTVTPVLCSFLLDKRGSFKSEKESLTVRLLKKAGNRTLQFTLDRPGLVFSFAIAALIASIALIPGMGRNFLPPFNEGSMMMEVQARQGISLKASNQLATNIEQTLLEIPEVRSIGRRTGRAENDDHSQGIHHTEFEIALNQSERTRNEILNDIRSRTKPFVPKDGFMSISQPISHRLDHILSGIKSQVAIKVFGPDLRILRQAAASVHNAIKDVPGVVDLRREGQVLFPQYKVYAMREDVRKYGILPGELTESLEAMLQGVPVAKLIEKDRHLDVYLRLDEESRKDLGALRKLPVHVLPTGDVIPLNDITDIFETSGPNIIEKENLSRRIVVSFNTKDRDLEAIVNDVKARLASLELKEGYRWEVDGQYVNQVKAMRNVLLLGLLSILAIFLVLYSQFKSAVIALQLMVNIPLALIGSVLAVYFTGGTFSVATLIAFVTLCGIASRNGILMISHYVHLMKEEGMVFGRDMVIRGTLERLVPVFMTAFTAILALTPLLLAKDQPGKEILHPVAVVIVGGLLTSTLLDVLVTPALFLRFGKNASNRILAHDQNEL
jgi:Cu(I)/Ag(I) efflux system membrane protein CusA/SilA